MGRCPKPRGVFRPKKVRLMIEAIYVIWFEGR